MTQNEIEDNAKSREVETSKEKTNGERRGRGKRQESAELY